MDRVDEQASRRSTCANAAEPPLLAGFDDDGVDGVIATTSVVDGVVENVSMEYVVAGSSVSVVDNHDGCCTTVGGGSCCNSDVVSAASSNNICCSDRARALKYCVDRFSTLAKQKKHERNHKLLCVDNSNHQPLPSLRLFVRPTLESASLIVTRKCMVNFHTESHIESHHKCKAYFLPSFGGTLLSTQ